MVRKATADPTRIAAELESPPPTGSVLASSAFDPRHGNARRDQLRRHALVVIRPLRLAALDRQIDIELGDLPFKRRRCKSHAAVIPPAADNQHLRLDRHRKDKAVVVIRVLANEIHAARRG